MVATKGIERTVSKYVARAAVAEPEYRAGIANPKRAWAAAALGASGTFHAAVTAPSTKALFEAGIKKAGDAKWKKMAEDKGAARFADGVEKSKDFFKSAMSDVLATIEATSIGKRGPRGSAQNYARSKDLGTALHAKRLAARSVV